MAGSSRAERLPGWRPRAAGPRGAAARASASKRGGLFARPWWPWARRIVIGAFLLGVLGLLVHLGREVDWTEVGRSIRAQQAGTLALALAFAATSQALYSSFDLLGRHLTGHGLGIGRVLAVCWQSYVFNLNFGSMVGGVGFRLRLYTRLGLAPGDIATVFTASLITNWLGYLLLAGAVFVMGPFALPSGWALGAAGLRVLGAVLLLLALSYVAACALSPRRSFHVAGREVALPGAGLALLQCTLSALNWGCIAAIIHTLLGRQVPYVDVLGALLLASGTGLIVRVPAGLGVLEAVFIALLTPELPQPTVLGALLTYRAIYFLLPLLPALLAYGLTELGLRRRGAPPAPA